MKYYIYGLQRSGTNVIQTFLEKNFKISFMNNGDKQSPYHKHFRIYNNKDLIPQTNIKNQYKNQIIINFLKEFDEILDDYNESNRYIIVYKNIFSWLPIIERWAKKFNWITNSKNEFIEDYLNFLTKWISIKNERVFFIKYEEFLNMSNDSNNVFMNTLSVFLNNKHLNIISSFEKVKCSEKFTSNLKKYYNNHEYMGLYSKEEISKIKTDVISHFKSIMSKRTIILFTMLSNQLSDTFFWTIFINSSKNETVYIINNSKNNNIILPFFSKKNRYTNSYNSTFILSQPSIIKEIKNPIDVVIDLAPFDRVSDSLLSLLSFTTESRYILFSNTIKQVKENNIFNTISNKQYIPLSYSNKIVIPSSLWCQLDLNISNQLKTREFEELSERLSPNTPGARLEVDKMYKRCQNYLPIKIKEDIEKNNGRKLFAQRVIFLLESQASFFLRKISFDKEYHRKLVFISMCILYITKVTYERGIFKTEYLEDELKAKKNFIEYIDKYNCELQNNYNIIVLAVLYCNKDEKSSLPSIEDCIQFVSTLKLNKKF